ncbi:LiaF transmembrane domain-containing protein [Candidatus Leptofilum sp.]|uniref:LiaF transmembrane domain-containing protein n=1 Tax=Candidatus Leptofilum sp. TaxID=3241576 RepID=UPI003B59BFF6
MNDQLKREEKQYVEQSNNTIMAAIFIVVGVVLIFSNVTGFGFANWWVLFMAIPLAGFGRHIYNDYQANGRLTAASTGAIIASIAILFAAATFLFEAITWGMVWPVGLIFAGIGMYLGNRS